MPNRKIRVPISFTPSASTWSLPNVEVPTPAQETDLEFYQDPANSQWQFKTVTVVNGGDQFTCKPPGNSGNTITVKDTFTSGGTWAYSVTVTSGNADYTSPISGLTVGIEPTPRIVNDVSVP